MAIETSGTTLDDENGREENGWKPFPWQWRKPRVRDTMRAVSGVLVVALGAGYVPPEAPSTIGVSVVCLHSLAELAHSCIRRR